eukprot:scaffold123604_cov28-Tisochrysis_lutea.AAC.1
MSRPGAWRPVEAHEGAERLAADPVCVSAPSPPTHSRPLRLGHGVVVGWLAGSPVRPSGWRRRVRGRMEWHRKGRGWWAVLTQPFGAALAREATASAPCVARIAEPPCQARRLWAQSAPRLIDRHGRWGRL